MFDDFDSHASEEGCILMENIFSRCVLCDFAHLHLHLLQI